MQTLPKYEHVPVVSCAYCNRELPSIYLHEVEVTYDYDQLSTMGLCDQCADIEHKDTCLQRNNQHNKLFHNS
jgi:hypothetical protein